MNVSPVADDDLPLIDIGDESHRVFIAIDPELLASLPHGERRTLLHRE